MKLIADMHTHTLASDHAYSTLIENINSAREAGLKYIAMTDHNINMEDAPHPWHLGNMRAIPKVVNGIRVIRGVEANLIDHKGNIDIFEDYLYDIIEWIVASYHHPACMPSTKDEHTESYLRLLDNPRVNVIGHCVTEDFDFDFDEVMAYCTEKNRLIELNDSRLPRENERYKKILKACEKHGTKIIVNSDAHFCARVGEFSKSIDLLKSIDFPEELVVNADLERFESYISEFITI